MRKFYAGASVGMLIGVAITLASCSKDDEIMELSYNLDVSSRIPLTRTAASDWEPGGGKSLYDIPQNQDECMLYAIISIAASKGIPITYRTSDGNGGYKETTKTIGSPAKACG